MPFVVATKKLSEPQKNLLIQGNIEITDYNAIKKYRLENSSANINFPVSAIVSSTYATQLLLDQHPQFQQLYVVGKKSAALLRENGFKPDYVAEYAAELATYIIRYHPQESDLYFFCSKQRREELPDKLVGNGLNLKEIHLYDIKPNHLSFQRKIDAVLFLSPSAVRSFCEANTQRNFIAFCIGNTTAMQAEKYRLKTQVPNSTTYESLIATCVKYFQS